MNSNFLSDMTWEDLKNLDLSHSVAILPAGATEAHGPHLPLGTDVIIAESMAKDTVEKLAAKNIHALILPSLTCTVAEFASAFTGTISIRPQTATALILDIAESMKKIGIPLLAIANAHLEPAHISSIIEAVKTINNEESMKAVFPDITRKPWALRLTDEFKSGACHAGQYETSIIMAARPDLVREDIRKKLQSNPASLSKAILEGKKNFAEADGPNAYFGYPQDATKNEGMETIGTLGSILYDAIIESNTINIQD